MAGTIQQLVGSQTPTGAIFGGYYALSDLTTLYFDPTEATRELLCRTPGTFSNLQLTLSGNFGGGDAVATVRINAVGATLTISIPDSTTGTFYDTTHSDAVADGDRYALEIAGGILQICLVGVEFQPTSGSVTRWASVELNTLNSGVTAFYGLTSDASSVFVETEAEWKTAQPATLRNAQVYVSLNSLNGSSTYTSRKNAGAGTLTMSVPTATTGRFEDTTHTDALALNDIAYWKLVTGGSSGSIKPEILSVEVSYTDVSRRWSGSIRGYSCGLGTLSQYLSIGGTGDENTGSTEADEQYRVRHLVTLSNLRVRAYSNTLTTALVFKTRKNTADGNQTISIGAGATGYFEDTTHADTLAAGDDIALYAEHSDANGAHFAQIFDKGLLATAGSLLTLTTTAVPAFATLRKAPAAFKTPSALAAPVTRRAAVGAIRTLALAALLTVTKAVSSTLRGLSVSCGVLLQRGFGRTRSLSVSTSATKQSAVGAFRSLSASPLLTVQKAIARTLRDLTTIVVTITTQASGATAYAITLTTTAVLALVTTLKAVSARRTPLVGVTSTRTSAIGKALRSITVSCTDTLQRGAGSVRSILVTATSARGANAITIARLATVAPVQTLRKAITSTLRTVLARISVTITSVLPSSLRPRTIQLVARVSTSPTMVGSIASARFAATYRTSFTLVGSE